MTRLRPGQRPTGPPSDLAVAAAVTAAIATLRGPRPTAPTPGPHPDPDAAAWAAGWADVDA